MRSHWNSVVMVAALALFMGIAAPAWSQQPALQYLSRPPTPALADPMAEDYAAHVIPFYKIDANWFAFLVVTDTSWRDLIELNPGSPIEGSPIDLTFYNSACNLVADATLRITKADAQFFALHDPVDAEGQFAAIPPEGVILLDGNGARFLTYILLINTNNNSLIRIDSIPCQGPPDPARPGYNGACTRGASVRGTWLRYDTFNTVAATFGDSDSTPFQTNLYFFSAVAANNDKGEGDLRRELLQYGRTRHGDWAEAIHVDGWCDEIYLGSRRLDLHCTQRVRLRSLNYTRLNEFPSDNCAGKPGHLETFATVNGTDVDTQERDYSGFQETIAELVPGVNMIGTGYMHHSESWDGSVVIPGKNSKQRVPAVPPAP
jgi:hypothetical protein